MTTIVYNRADVDSVIAAALFEMPHEKTAKYIPSGNLTGSDIDTEYIWIGVVPSLETIEYFKRNRREKKVIPKHTGYYACGSDELNSLKKHMTVLTAESDFNPNFFKDDRFQDEVYGENCQFPNTITSLIASFKLFDYHGIWPIVFAVSEHLSSSDYRGIKEFGPKWTNYVSAIQDQLKQQALLWSNYRAAIDSIDSATPFIPVKEPDIARYLTFIKSIKHQVNQLTEHTVITIDGKQVVMPILNVNQEITPWVLRVISFTHPYAVAYDNRKGRTVYTSKSAIAGFPNVILRGLKLDRKNVMVSSHA